MRTGGAEFVRWPHSGLSLVQAMSDLPCCPFLRRLTDRSKHGVCYFLAASAGAEAVSEEEYAQLETAAQADGRTLGEWCREALLASDQETKPTGPSGAEAPVYRTSP